MDKSRSRIWMSMMLLLGIATVGLGMPAGAAPGAPASPQGVGDASCFAPGPHGFTDVPADRYYNTAVAWLVEAGITGGTSPGKYSPNNPVTRAQMAVFLWHLKGDPTPRRPPQLHRRPHQQLLQHRRLMARRSRHHRRHLTRQILAKQPGHTRPNGRVPLALRRRPHPHRPPQLH
jgi:hypothetical protein